MGIQLNMSYLHVLSMALEIKIKKKLRKELNYKTKKIILNKIKIPLNVTNTQIQIKLEDRKDKDRGYEPLQKLSRI